MIYEIINTGKGLIVSLTPENLLKISSDIPPAVTPGLAEVLAAGNSVSADYGRDGIYTLTLGDSSISFTGTGTSNNSTSVLSSTLLSIEDINGRFGKIAPGFIELKTLPAGGAVTIRTSLVQTDKEFQFPNVAGTLPVSVNGIFADDNGNITIAAGGGTPQGLQSVLNVGGYAELDGANSAINILTGDVNNRVFNIYVGNGSSETSGLDMSTEWNYLYGNSAVGNRRSQIGIELNGQVYLQQKDYYDSLLKTKVIINTPVSNTILSFPAKTTAGTYTLAVTEDLAFEKVVAGASAGIIIRGRNPLNYGPIGGYAFDLSYSSGASTTMGATGEGSFVTGDDNIGSGYGTTVFGASNISNGIYSIVTGLDHTEAGYANALFGTGHEVTNGAYATVVGQFANSITNNMSNVNDASNTMFAIGNGFADGSGNLQSRSTAFQVYKSGAVTTPSLTTAMINDDVTGKMLITKEYLGAYSPTIQDNLETASATNVGKLRYRATANASYTDMSMQTGASIYEWTTIAENIW
jgi:hypothetical protein